MLWFFFTLHTNPRSDFASLLFKEVRHIIVQITMSAVVARKLDGAAGSMLAQPRIAPPGSMERLTGLDLVLCDERGGRLAEAALRDLLRAV